MQTFNNSFTLFVFKMFNSERLASLIWFLDKKGLLTIVYLRGRVKQEHKVIFLQNMNTLVSDSTPLLWNTSTLDRVNEKGFSHLDARQGEWERILTFRRSITLATQSCLIKEKMHLFFTHTLCIYYSVLHLIYTSLLCASILLSSFNNKAHLH